jgi:hypothetical protein
MTGTPSVFQTAPPQPGVKGFHDLVAGIGWRRRSQPEWIGRFDACEVGGKAWHFFDLLMIDD